MTKRWIAALLALVLCLSLAACGKEPADTAGETGITTSGQNTPNEPKGNKLPSGIARVEADYSTSEGYLSSLCFYDAEDTLKYKVEYVEEGCPLNVYTYAKNGDPIKSLYSNYGKRWQLVYEYELDEQEHKTGYTLYDKNSGERKGTRQFTYENDQLVCEVFFDAAGNETERFVYAYDAAGRKTLWEQYEGGATTPARREVFTYDESGNLIRWGIENPGFSAYNSTYTYEYDEKGQLLRRTKIGEDLYEEYAYDEYGNRIRETISHSGEWRYTYEPKKDGKLLSMEYETVKTAYTYDEDGHLIGIERNEAGVLVRKYSMTYDEKGNQITREHYTYTDGVETLAERFAYEYDDYGFRTKTVLYDAAGATVSEKEYEDTPLA